MRVEFLDSAKMPKKAFTVRKPPVLWRPQAKALLHDLLNQGIITEVKHNMNFHRGINVVYFR